MAQKPISTELLQLRRHNTMALFVRWRLREIAQGRPASDSSFAETLGIANAQWSRIKSGTPVGTKLARQIEAACGVASGWLDAPPQAGLELLSAEEAQTALREVLGIGTATPMSQADGQTGLSQPGIRMARVRGLSMINKGIDEGDLLVVDQTTSPKHGQTVVVAIQGEWVCKTLHQHDGEMQLRAVNPDFEDMVPDEEPATNVCGVVTTVIKKMAV